MSSENVELVRRLIEVWTNRDPAAPVGDFPGELVHEDFEFRPAVTGVVEAAVYRGRAGWTRYVEDVGAAWSRFSIEVEELRDLGDRVLAFGRLRAVGRGSGGGVDQPVAFVSTIREDRISQTHGFRTRQAALEAAGVPE
jgi:ketosteroid isomerase-like protein